MLTVLNNYMHGYVAVPVILACKRRGLFGILRFDKARAFSRLVTELQANSGHLRIALQMLESLAWVTRSSEDGYLLGPRCAILEKIPADIEDLLSFPMDAYLGKNNTQHSLRNWIDLSGRRWSLEDGRFADFLDGTLVIPLLLALKEKRLLKMSAAGTRGLFSILPPPAGGEVCDLFLHRGWAAREGKRIVLTDAGRFIWERIFIAATVASYRPMLSRLSEVIFGDCSSVFQRDASGHELHVDRTLNVIGSGFQHEKYFSDLEQIILEIFNREPVEEQPAFIADMGCGDGTLLKKTYEIVKHKSVRGRFLKKHPVRLIGIDFNEKALEQTARTLKGTDAVVVQGDIGDPARLMADLKKMGIRDMDSVLHVRSFLDHDRPYIPPSVADALPAGPAVPSEAVCVNKDGKLLATKAVIQSLSEHLGRWSKVVGRHGLVILEVHCLEPDIVREFLSESESLHFDCYHRFSQQLLLEADLFLMAAGERGLFPQPDSFKKYPKIMPFSRITLGHFQKKPYTIRHPGPGDIPLLVGLEESCLPPLYRSSSDEIRRRIDANPLGQFVLEIEGRLAGVLYSQRTKSTGQVRWELSDKPDWNHDRNGRVVELMYLLVPDGKDRKYGQEFLAHAALRCSVKNGIEEVAGQSRCARYLEHFSNARLSPRDELVRHIREYSAGYPIDPREDTLYAEAELEEFGARWLLRILQDRGVVKTSGTKSTAAELMRRLKVLPKYKSLFNSLLGILERDQLISIEGGIIRVKKKAQTFALRNVEKECAAFEKEFKRKHFSFMPFLRLMFTCLRQYGDVLAGKTEANDVVFPGGSMELFSGIFLGNSVADYFNNIVAEIISQRIYLRPADRRQAGISILEIGAGTGGTTKAVLPKIASCACEVKFLYTDISSAFTRHGKETFGKQYPWVSFERLNIEENPVAQGFEPESIDIVFAANVLHDTQYLVNTLANVKRLLKKEGLLILNEFTRMKDLLLYTGGLLHGWWLFKDPEYRLENTCLLSVDQWKTILEKCGFDHFEAYGLPYLQETSKYRQSVMLCELRATGHEGIPADAGTAATGHALPAPARTVRLKDGAVDGPGGIRHMVRESLAKIVGEKRLQAFSPDHPLMEAGMDSLELLEFRTLLNKRLGTALDSAFFFQYNTLDKISRYLKGRSYGDGKEQQAQLLPEEGSGNRASEGEIKAVVEESLRKIVGERRSVAFLPDRPLMEAGMDSLELLEFRTLLGRKLGIELDSAYFFQHNTIEKITGNLEKRLPTPSCSGATVRPAEGQVACGKERNSAVSPQHRRSADIAIVGMAFRFPGGIKTKDDFWDLLSEGKSAIGPMPEGRFRWPGHVDIKGDKAYLSQGGFLPRIDEFDASFFRISPKEAELMDPQQRLLLELNWEAIEDAGYKPADVRGSRTGVYVGACHFDYRKLVDARRPEIDAYMATGTSGSILANRLSYFYDLRGPSILIDTACSSSLVAIHEAVRGLREGVCIQAFAAGVNLICDPANSLMYDDAGMLSRDGICRTFDQGANGFVRGEGGAVIYLKRLEDAARDRDRIYAVIKGSAINHGGRASSPTAPNPEAQADLIRHALKDAETGTETISYVEAHGTATSLGDPIEVEGLGQAFASSEAGQKERFCGLGSVKANIGHLEGAAGIAGLVKVVLSLGRKTIPASINFRDLNREIRLGAPFYIAWETREWKRMLDERENETPRRAGVSAFGFGGANAHVVVEEYEEGPSGQESVNRGPHLVVLSAKTPEVLIRHAGNMLEFLEAKNDPARCPRLDDVAYTLQVGREAMRERLALVVSTHEDLIDKLKRYCSGEKEIEDVYTGSAKNVPGDRTSPAGLEPGSGPLATVLNWKEYGKLARLWTSGFSFDWSLLSRDRKPRRISLPAYPFARHRHWAADSTASATEAASGSQHGVSGSEAGRRLIRKPQTTTLLLEPCWREEDAEQQAATSWTFSKHIVLLCESDPIYAQRIEKALSGAACRAMQSDRRNIDERFQDYAVRLFREVQSVLTEKEKGKVLVQVLAPCGVDQLLLAGLSGLLKTASRENPRCIGQLIQTDPGERVEGIIEKLRRNSSRPEDRHIRYRSGKRYVAGWNEIEQAHKETVVPWKDRGVYLITGGAGGIGLLIAAEIASTAREAMVVLTGRSPLDEARQSRLKELMLSSSRIEYKSVDVTDGTSIDALIKSIRGEHGRLNGIIHAAGIIRDNFIIRKTDAEFQDVLGPKVIGLMNLVRAAGDIPLDFMVAFSSIAGAFGNPGQSDYAAANAFMDAYADYHNARAASGRYACRVVSVGWPLWKQGGMVVDEDTEKMLMQSFGMIALETSEGIQALYRVLASGKSHVMVMSGDAHQIKQKLPAPRKKEENPSPVRISRPAVDVQAELTHMVSQLTGVSPKDIDADAELSEMGLDQVAINTLAKNVSVSYEIHLDPSLFLEHSTLRRVSAFLTNQLGSGAARVEPEMLREQTLHQLKVLFGETARLNVDSIDAGEPLENYGIDSIMIKRLNQQLEPVFGELSKTVFYEYQTLGALADHLIEDFPQECAVWAGVAGRDPAVQDAPSTPERVDRKFSIITEQRERNADTGDQTREPIAVIGMSGRYPLAENPEAFWENLKTGKECVTEIPKERWSLDGFYHPDPNEAVAQGKSYGKWGGFLEGFADFDPLFFNISPKEAIDTDPQERLFIQSSWEVIEDAGYTRELLAERHNRRVGVFVGITKTGFDLYGPELWKQGRKGFPRTSFGSTANRVSYLLNLQGPSMPIDTMCSSSLTAIHEACEHLQRGECEMAIAGGVNLYLHPSSYVFLSSLRMISTDGHCRSFGQGSSGFVPGEGVGCILLKPLSRAEADGDHIYGVIRGTSINHGGKTNGYTVPSPAAQGELVRRALEKAGVHARAVSYIEAHGTGTELGDPIEITGLTQAFRHDTADREYCAIGSVKSNIGHLEAAAGIAGVTKILLQMKHRMIAPTLHAETLNPNINFPKTPFVVQREPAEWKRPVIEINGKAGEYPRIAGISSFGAGGSNAHVVIEEYIPRGRELADSSLSPREQAIIVLSAKNGERLKEQTRRLLSAIRQGRFSDNDLPGVAYTLQTGREAMEERLAMTAGSMKELETKLSDFVEDRVGKDIYRGQVKRNKETLDVFAADEDMAKTIAAWVAKKKYSKLLVLWVTGLIVDWRRLYNGAEPRRVSLPTYPFERERFWLPEQKGQSGEASTGAIIGAGQALHPLLHENTSDFSGQRFSSTFTGREFFLADHVVGGLRTLPAAAYLEMVRAAVDRAAGTGKEGRTGIRLRNIVWVRPFVVNGRPERVHIGLYPEETGEIGFEIYSRSEENGKEPIVHSQGTAELTAPPEAGPLDIEALRSSGCRSSFSPSRLYEAFKAAGFDYGPGHRGLEEVLAAEDRVLAKLLLPPSVSDTKDRYVLHPSMLDSALQATIALTRDRESSGSLAPLEPALPFALQEMEIFGGCAPEMWALVRNSPGSRSADPVRKIDIDLCDEQGAVIVRMKGFSARPPAGETKPAGRAAMQGTVLLEPGWKEKAVAPDTAAPDYVRRLVLFCEADDSLVQDVETRLRGVPCRGLRSAQTGAGDRYAACAVQVFEEIRGILGNSSAGKDLLQVVVSAGAEQELFAGLLGMVRTAGLENPNLRGQVIEMEPGSNAGDIADKLDENGRSPHESRIRYQGGKRFVEDWSEIEKASETPGLPWKDKGVYLITGGAGGLGLIFAREIAQSVKDAVLVLAGRSSLDTLRKPPLKELEETGCFIEYNQVDVTDKSQVAGLIAVIRQKFGRLDGIIHAAGVNRDNFILKKTPEELTTVLAPKVAGLVNLDEASNTENLDFFVFFSSAAGVLGNPGQADYAAANAFMDAYSSLRNRLVAAGQRKGRTLSVDWPLWKEGGMQVDEETEKTLESRTGITAMETSAGISAFYQAWASGRHRIMVLRGDVKRIQETLVKKNPGHGDSVRTTVVREIENVSAPAEDLLAEKAIQYFKKLLSGLIKLSANKIEADAPMEKYGIDSIMVMQMTNHLEKTFGSLPKTLFFEYQNIRALTGYFLEFHRDRLTGLVAPREAAEAAENPRETAASREISACRDRRRPRPAQLDIRGKEKASGAPDIAIIGVSGRYPGAGTIREFWKNLRDGKDCITEIPKDRWDHSRYFDEDKAKKGKVYSRWGGFLEGVDLFDPLFFNISPREAEIMDPQERLFLECVYGTIEDAGYTREALARNRGRGLEGNVGVYVGVMYEEYQLYGAQEQTLGRTVALGGSPSSIANRVSYFCNFHGPSMAVDTMCSSSLTAIHLACESLVRGACELAIAGGVNVSIHPNKYLMLSQGKFISSSGRCESFGRGGDGYVPGEGVGAVLLKPLKAAVADGDHIYGVIKSTSINHGGRTNGYTVPNPLAQADVIGRAFEDAGINPRMISYIEAHGTGTSLGDPIEIAGLAKAFQKYTNDRQFCAIGSAKSNIGHCESAAGIAGVTKVLLQLQHGQLAPSLHSDPLNPNIDFKNSPFFVQQQLSEWERPKIEVNGAAREYPRIAGISSFGAGGSNAHVVIEEYIPEDRDRPSVAVTAANPAIIVLSAKNEDRLKAHVRQLLAAFQEREFTDADLADITYTLQVGREAMEERIAVIAGSVREAEEKLNNYAEGREDIEDLYRGQARRDETMPAFFEADEELQEAVDRWIQRKKFPKLLDLWVKGLILDWNKLYGETRPRRLSLPAYPFARRRFWAPGNTAEATGSEANIMPVADPVDPVAPQSVSPALRPVGIHLNQSPRPVPRPGDGDLVEKPAGILLRPFSDVLALSSDPLDQPRQPVQLASTMKNEIRPANREQGKAFGSLEEELAASLAEALYMERNEVDPDKKFVEMGLDSIVGVEWIRTVNKRYGTSIPATKVYDCPTIREFADFLKEELGTRTALNGSGESIERPSRQPVSVPKGPLHAALEANESRKPFRSSKQAGAALEEELAASLAEALYMARDEVQPDKKFVEMGLDSVLGVEWIRTVNERYGTSIPATKVYDCPTIREFAVFLGKELNGRAGGRSASLLPPTAVLSLDEVLEKVEQGTLSIQEADQLLHQFQYQGEAK